MTVATESQQLETDATCILNSGCVASGLLRRIACHTVRQTELLRCKLEMTTQLIMHVGSEAVVISGRQPHVFIEVETQPAALQVRKTRRRPCGKTLDQDPVERLHGPAGGKPERFETLLLQSRVEVIDDMVNDRLHQRDRFRAALDGNSGQELRHAVTAAFNPSRLAPEGCRMPLMGHRPTDRA